MGTRIQIPARATTDRVIATLTKAERLLQEATNVQQAKVVADFGAAQEVFAHRQGGKKESPRGTFTEPRDSAATYAELGLSKKHARDAQQLAALPAPVREEVASREKSLAQARREEKKKHLTTVELPSGTFGVVYADPPWQDSSITDADNDGQAVRHYPSMTVAQLCQLDVKSRVADDAVLFLWVTSSHLADCWRVVKAWGFTYMTSFVWDKVDHNGGHYNGVRHELLLVCTRGTCLPDHPTPLPDSVMTVKRSDACSEKPEDFRQLIDRMYDGGADQKLELFGRQPRDGWMQFGHEAA